VPRFRRRYEERSGGHCRHALPPRFDCNAELGALFDRGSYLTAEAERQIPEAVIAMTGPDGDGGPCLF